MSKQSEMYSLAKAAGLPDSRAKIAAAIGMAESGGNPRAHNPNRNTGDNSYGLWQINMLDSMGPARRTQFGLSSNEELFDPAVNARVMSIMSHQGQNFSPWSTYKRGEHKKYLPITVKDVLDPFGLGQKLGAGGLRVPGVGDAIEGASAAVDAAKTGANALIKGAAWVSNPQNWIRVAYVIGGSVVVITGVVLIVQSSAPGRTAIKLGKKTAKSAVKVATTKGVVK